MSKKSPRIAALLAELPAHPTYSRYYLGYFSCFNQELYYEAHDVLEELWLGCKTEADGNFYKGLIQLAGAYVHLQKERLRPASNLFALAQANLEPYPTPHHGLHLDAICRLCQDQRRLLAEGDYRRNPWRPAQGPRLLPL